MSVALRHVDYGKHANLPDTLVDGASPPSVDTAVDRVDLSKTLPGLPPNDERR